MTTAIVSGALATKYLNGGNAWTRLSWVLGLKKLGFRVYFIEQIGRDSCVDASGAVAPFEQCVNAGYFEQVCEQFGLWGAAALVYENGERTHGLSYAELVDVARSADLLINISGHLTLERLKGPRCWKVYFDDDPGFTQFWHAAGNAGPRLAGHDFYFTIGENIGTPSCPIPTGDIPWRRMRPLVVLGQWPVSHEGARDRFTTVASWRGPYGPVQYGGQTYGLKVHEFRKVFELPERARQMFEIALSIHPADEKDLNQLRQHGWKIVDPRAAVPDPGAYRRYVQTSGGEFSVAQGVYVQTGSGWFSDRTACYLASGKPVLVQDTGFSRNYPVGEGLVAFRTLEQAVGGAERILRDYDSHCRAARALAETYFDSDKVLGKVLEEVGVAV
jgi:hypothetical protein